MAYEKKAKESAAPSKAAQPKKASLDQLIAAGGYCSVNTGSAPDANSIPVPKEDSDLAMDAAQCIGCGACVAACKNASAMLFVAAKVSHLGLLPQGQPERDQRVMDMVAQHDDVMPAAPAGPIGAVFAARLGLVSRQRGCALAAALRPSLRWRAPRTPVRAPGDTPASGSRGLANWWR